MELDKFLTPRMEPDMTVSAPVWRSWGFSRRDDAVRPRWIGASCAEKDSVAGLKEVCTTTMMGGSGTLAPTSCTGCALTWSCTAKPPRALSTTDAALDESAPDPGGGLPDEAAGWSWVDDA